MNFGKRLAVVTGGGSGIGRAIALRLADEGWHVCVADINLSGAEETLRMVQSSGGSGQVERLDVTCHEEWDSLLKTLRSDHDDLGLLVNNAGVCAGGEFDQGQVDTWDWIQNIKLRGAMLGCRVMVPWLKENRQRSYILNIASIAGLVYSPRMAPYNVSKAALIALSETLYHELKPYKIGVTAVCPWFCPTNLLENGRFNKTSELEYARREMSYTLVTPEKVARKALTAMYWGTRVRVIGARANFIWYVKRYCPPLAALMVDALYRFNMQPTAQRQDGHVTSLPEESRISNANTDSMRSDKRTAVLQSSRQ